MKRNSKMHFGIAWFFIVPILLMGATSGWIHAGYPGPLQKNIKGGFGRFVSGDFHTYNVNNSSPSGMVLLLGDSEAQSIQDVFNSRFASASIIRAMSGCSFIPANVRYKYSDSRDCDAFYKNSLNLVSRTSESQIYIFNRYLPTSISESDDYISFLRKIAGNGNSVTLVGQPIEIRESYGAYSSLISKLPFGSLESIPLEGFDKTSIDRWATFKKELNLLGSDVVRLIDTEKILCPAYPCEIIDSDGESKYTDSVHLSLYGAKLLVSFF